MYTDPTIADFKVYYTRDFPYGTTSDTVMDTDISSAFLDADLNINQNLFASQQNYSQAFLWLSAHYLVLNLRASSQGIAGQYNWLTSSKGVGSVSEGFSIPERIMENPILAAYSKTTYGAKYLLYVLPLLAGQMFIVRGRTNP